MEAIPGAQAKVALYARVSTDEQREGQTIKSQLAELERFAEQNGWTVHERYLDEGWSGALLARPELDRLRDDAGRGLFGMVIINDVDRLARDVNHLGVIKRDLEHKRVRLVFRKLPTTADPMSNFMINILGSFAEFEREMIADRTRRGMRHKVEVKKEYVGCTAPYGYRYIRKALSNDKGILEINPTEAATVRQIFNWVVEEGLSLNQIAKRLGRLQIPTRAGKSNWQVCTVQRIARNEVYVGLWSYGKHETCEPINPRNKSPYRRKRTSRRPRRKTEWLRISLPSELHILERALWEAAQKQIDKNPRLSPRNAKLKYLLQGLVKCAACSSVMSGTYSRDESGIYVYYRCWRRCGQTRWTPRNDLESTVWQTVREALLNPDHLKSNVTSAIKRISNNRQEIDQRQMDISLEQIEHLENAVMRKYQSGDVSSNHLHRELDRLQAIKDGIRTQPSSQVNHAYADSAIDEYCHQVKERLMNPTFEMKQQILRRLVNTIFVERTSVRIAGAIAVAGNAEVRTAAYPPPQEQTCNRRGVNFELTARLSARKRRWGRRPGGSSAIRK
jgi:site-specific DNA recombinase